MALQGAKSMTADAAAVWLEVPQDAVKSWKGCSEKLFFKMLCLKKQELEKSGAMRSNT